MNAQELLKRYNDGEKDLVFDVRSKEKYDKYHLPHAIHIEPNVLAHNAEKYIEDKDQDVYVTCNSGNTSGTVMMMMNANGYNIISVEDGMNPLMDKLGMETVACKVK